MTGAGDSTIMDESEFRRSARILGIMIRLRLPNWVKNSRLENTLNTIKHQSSIANFIFLSILVLFLLVNIFLILGVKLLDQDKIRFLSKCFLCSGIICFRCQRPFHQPSGRSSPFPCARTQQ